MPTLTREAIQQDIDQNDGVITAQASVDLSTLMAGLEGVNDHVSEQLVGSPALTDISYRVAPDQADQGAVTLDATGVVDEDTLHLHPNQ